MRRFQCGNEAGQQRDDAQKRADATSANGSQGLSPNSILLASRPASNASAVPAANPTSSMMAASRQQGTDDASATRAERDANADFAPPLCQKYDSTPYSPITTRMAARIPKAPDSMAINAVTDEVVKDSLLEVEELHDHPGMLLFETSRTASQPTRGHRAMQTSSPFPALRGHRKLIDRHERHRRRVCTQIAVLRIRNRPDNLVGPLGIVRFRPHMHVLTERRCVRKYTCGEMSGSRPTQAEHRSCLDR